MLRKISQRDDKYQMSSLICGIERKIKQENRKCQTYSLNCKIIITMQKYFTDESEKYFTDPTLHTLGALFMVP